jgi:hypothetical protein
VLVEKLRVVGSPDVGLQLAAHDDASGSRDAAEQILRELSETYRQDAATYAKIGDFWLHRNEIELAGKWYEAGAGL